jgi:hypothetical protein
MAALRNEGSIQERAFLWRASQHILGNTSSGVDLAIHFSCTGLEQGCPGTKYFGTHGERRVFRLK